jgi:tRNA (cmo5U34)-methyltransferase
MENQMHNKSTNEEIRKRFDADVERFSQLETGQKAAIDAPIMLELLARAASGVTPGARRVLDLGCGAGNQTLKLLQYLPGLDCTLVDLSRPMLDRARERIEPVTGGRVETWQGDLREMPFEPAAFDVILAGAVLHHLREEEDWRAVFGRLFTLTAPGGSLWVSDLISHGSAAMRDLFQARYAEHLRGHGDEEYVRAVFDYIDSEDSPRPLLWQLDLLREVGFEDVEVLHKNGPFAAFGGVRAAR